MNIWTTISNLSREDWRLIGNVAIIVVGIIFAVFMLWKRPPKIPDFIIISVVTYNRLGTEFSGYVIINGERYNYTGRKARGSIHITMPGSDKIDPEHFRLAKIGIKINEKNAQKPHLN